MYMFLQVRKTKKPSSYFEEAPPPLESDINFTDMNLSRPLLKVSCCIHNIVMHMCVLKLRCHFSNREQKYPFVLINARRTSVTVVCLSVCVLPVY